MWNCSCKILLCICSVGYAAAAATVEAAAEVVEVEAVEVEASVAAVEAEAVEADAETEEGAEARVGVALVLDLEEPKLSIGCRCAMKRICPPCPFGTGKGCAPFWRVQSSPWYRVTLFAITGTCAECAGRTPSVKTHTFPPPLV